MRVLNLFVSIVFIRSKISSCLRKPKFIVLAVIIFTSIFNANPAPAKIVDMDSIKIPKTRQEKIKAYIEFKKQYEDKDFELKSRFITRTKTLNGKVVFSRFAIYHIDYGTIADTRDAYNRNSMRIIRTPTRKESSIIPDCNESLYVEKYDESGLHPAIKCFQPDEHSYPVKLIFEGLSEEEIEHVVLINEFKEGDTDIHFSFEKATDRKFMQKALDKLQKADEKNDDNAPQTKMSPIIPSAHQRVSIAYIDSDKDGEPDSVLLPHCINGSYFDQDPYNNTVQVGLKYALITKSDLAHKTTSDQPDAQKQMGLWKWDRPTEILISFCENPGPDIVFYDLGKVVNGMIIDPEPDGEFDQYEFLY